MRRSGRGRTDLYRTGDQWCRRYSTAYRQWHNHDNQCLGLLIADDDKQYQMLLILNASDLSHEYVLPKGSKRKLLVDTSSPEGTHAIEWLPVKYKQHAQSLSLWQIDYP